MAIEQTVITIPPKTFGLTNLPEPLTIGSAIPRQELLFDSFSEIIPVPGAGDFQSIVWVCKLPTGFAYATTDFFMSVSGADAADWNKTSLVEFLDSVADTTWRIKIESAETFEVQGLANNACVRGYVWPVLPSRLILPGDDGAEIRASVANTTIDGASATANFSARFMVYDLAQAHHWSVNTPQLIR